MSYDHFESKIKGKTFSSFKQSTSEHYIRCCIFAVRPVLTIIISNKSHTKQVDYNNAFAQAEIQADEYIEPPHRFGGAHKLPKGPSAT